MAVIVIGAFICFLLIDIALAIKSMKILQKHYLQSMQLMQQMILSNLHELKDWVDMPLKYDWQKNDGKKQE